jgi:hypothetical protein
VAHNDKVKLQPKFCFNNNNNRGNYLFTRNAHMRRKSRDTKKERHEKIIVGASYFCQKRKKKLNFESVGL